MHETSRREMLKLGSTSLVATGLAESTSKTTEARDVTSQRVENFDQLVVAVVEHSKTLRSPAAIVAAIELWDGRIITAEDCFCRVQPHLEASAATFEDSRPLRQRLHALLKGDCVKHNSFFVRITGGDYPRTLCWKINWLKEFRQQAEWMLPDGPLFIEWDAVTNANLCKLTGQPFQLKLDNRRDTWLLVTDLSAAPCSRADPIFNGVLALQRELLCDDYLLLNPRRAVELSDQGKIQFVRGSLGQFSHIEQDPAPPFGRFAFFDFE